MAKRSKAYRKQQQQKPKQNTPYFLRTKQFQKEIKRQFKYIELCVEEGNNPSCAEYAGLMQFIYGDGPLPYRMCGQELIKVSEKAIYAVITNFASINVPELPPTPPLNSVRCTFWVPHGAATTEPNGCNVSILKNGQVLLHKGGEYVV